MFDMKGKVVAVSVRAIGPELVGLAGGPAAMADRARDDVYEIHETREAVR